MVAHYLIPETWLLDLETKEEIIATGINTISAMARAWGELGYMTKVDKLKELVVEADDLPWLPFCRRNIDFKNEEIVYALSGVGLSSPFNPISQNKTGLFRGKISDRLINGRGVELDNFGFNSFCFFEKGNQYLISENDLKYVITHRQSFGNKWLENSYPEENKIVKNIIFKEFSNYKIRKQFFIF